MEQTKQKKKVSAKKVIGIVLDVLLYVFLALAVVIVALTIMSKVAQKEDPNGAPNLFGYEMRYVETGSMEPEYPVNTMIFIEKAPTNYEDSIKWFDGIKKGDVLTFKYREAGQQVVITHRVVDIQPNTDMYMGQPKGGYKIYLEGDNKGSDNQATQQIIYTYAHYNDMADANDQIQGHVIGKVVGQSRVLGAMVTTLKNPLGMVLIIIVPCLIVIIIEVIRIIKVFNSEKHEKAKKKQAEQQEKLDKQNDEIELLKQQLALLQQQAGQMQATSVSVTEKVEVVEEIELKQAEDEVQPEQVESEVQAEQEESENEEDSSNEDDKNE
jgi:signal peptidase